MSLLSRIPSEEGIRRSKSFLIDGPGGERINTVRVAVTDVSSGKKPPHFPEGIPVHYEVCQFFFVYKGFLVNSRYRLLPTMEQRYRHEI